MKILIALINSEKKEMGMEKQFQYIANFKHQILC